MSRIQVEGKACLQGTVSVQGSKNAALPMMAAALLHAGRTRLHNCPRIADVFAMEDILHGLGVHTFWAGHTLVIDSTCLLQPEIPADAASRLRASVLLAGSLLWPVPLCCDGLSRWLCDRQPSGGPASGSVCGAWCSIHLPGGAACGGSRSAVWCKDPFPEAFGGCYRKCIAGGGMCLWRECAGKCCHRAGGVGTDFSLTPDGCRYRMDGGRKLPHPGTEHRSHGTDFLIPVDRIEAGTWLFAGAMTRGRLMIHRAPVEQMAAVLSIYRKMGGQYLANSGTLIADSRQVCRAIEAETDVYPGFPTDLQPVLMAVCATLHGESRIRETVFENRFRIAEQLARLGADIHIQKDTAYIEGSARWRAGTVEATDLRAGAALVLAGLVCEGCVTIKHSERIDRGYRRDR